MQVGTLPDFLMFQIYFSLNGSNSIQIKIIFLLNLDIQTRKQWAGSINWG